MSKCRDFQQTIYLYSYEELSPQERKSLEKHLSQCERCKLQLQKAKVTLNAIRERKIPEVSPQFWNDYNITLKRKLAESKKEKFSLGIILEFIQEKIKNILSLPSLEFKVIPAIVVVSILILVGIFTFARYYLLKDIDTIPLPVQVAQQQLPSPEFPGEKEVVFNGTLESWEISEELEEELILQDLVLLMEMGEDLDLLLEDEDLMEEMKIIIEIGSS